MSLPTSLVLGALVVAWLVVLVPMIAKYRQSVPRSSDGTGRFRVLQRKSGEGRKVRWGRRDDSDFADLEPEELDDTDLQQQILETDDEYVAETAEYEDDFDEYDEVALDESDDEAAFDDAYEYDEYDDEVEAPTPLRAADRDPDVDDYDNERYRPVPVRHGRGGYDPEQAERTRAYRFQRRRRVTLALTLLTLISGVAAQFLFTPAWYACGIFGALLVGYLGYLRRQVRVEADIRARRMARLRRARQIRPEVRATRSGRQVPESVYDTRRQIVDLDDDDPAFDELDHYHAPVAYRRAVGE